MEIRTTFVTSSNRGGRRSASVSSGGVVGRGGRFVSRRQRYGDMRSAMGLSSG